MVEVTDTRVRLWSPVCEAVARLLGPHAEGGAARPRAGPGARGLAPADQRGPGDHSYWGELDQLEPSAHDVWGPYEKLLPDGRRLSSVSAILRGDDGRPSAVLCVNLDRSPLDRAAALLTAFAAPTAPRPEPLFEQDWNGASAPDHRSLRHASGGARSSGSAGPTGSRCSPSSTGPACSPCAGRCRLSPRRCRRRGPPSTRSRRGQGAPEQLMTALPEFRLETFFSRWEFAARHHLTASDAQTMTMAELLELADDTDRHAWRTMSLGYTETFATRCCVRRSPRPTSTPTPTT